MTSILTTPGTEQRLLRNVNSTRVKPVNAFKRAVSEKKLNAYNSVVLPVEIDGDKIVAPIINSDGASKIISTLSGAFSKSLLSTMEYIVEQETNSRGFETPRYEAVKFLTEVLYMNDLYYEDVKINATVLSASAIAAAVRSVGLTLTACYSSVGRIVYLEACYLKYAPATKKKALQQTAGADAGKVNALVMPLAGNNDIVDTYPPSLELFLKIGVLFVELLEQAGLITFDVNPDNSHIMRLAKPIEEFIADVSVNAALMQPVKTPLTEKPLEWTSLTEGGFHNKAMRKLYPLLKRKLWRTGASEGLYSQYRDLEEVPEFIKSVNILQNTAFKINETVLQVAQTIWNSGEELGSLSRSKPLDTSLPPDVYELYNNHYKQFIRDKYGNRESKQASDTNKFGEKWPSRPSARYMWTAFMEYMLSTGALTEEQCHNYTQHFNRRLSNLYENNLSSTYSNYLGCYMLMSIAEELKGKPFWYVWTLDSRGRVYAESTDINPQGTDIHKAMHLFQEEVPLTNRGLYHLKLQLCSTMDKYDDVDLTKLPLADRIAWADKHFEFIHAMGSAPLDYVEHWRNAGEPWMFLATCVEIAKCCNSDGSIKNGATTCLPVAKDGSCNALQYCAALSLDTELAKEVNLIDNYRPGDIYSRVAKGMLEILEKAERGEEKYAALFEVRKGKGSDAKELMKHLRPLISRKLAKHPTMTLFYGATSFGMRSMCEKVIYDTLGKDGIAKIGNQFYLDLATAAGNVVRVAISEKIKGADILMNISKHVAKFLSEAGLPIIWSTVDGFTVVQDYVKKGGVKRVRTINSDCQVVKIHAGTSSTDVSDTNRSVNGISPNFVHSYDGTLVRLVASRMNKVADVSSFMMIHDSFAVHAEHCDLLDKTVRQEFVQLIEQRPYESWLEEVLGILNAEKYAEFVAATREKVINGELLNLDVYDNDDMELVKGSLELRDEVLNSRFFFA